MPNLSLTNYVNSEMNGFLNSNFTSGLINGTRNIFMSKLKNTFGTEFYVDNATENSQFNEGIMNYLRDHDKNFDEHYDSVRERLYPFTTFSILDMRTFMFIATKYNVPGKMKSSFLEDKMSADLYVYIFGRNCRKYAAEFTKILDDRDKGSRNDIIYTVNSIGGSRGTDISCLNLQKRDMDTLIFSDGEIEKVREFINRFNNGNSFYKEKQLCYKTGILLYGSPGTGKSSLVKAIATEFHRGIVQIEVSNIPGIDFTHLTMMINNEDEETYIVLFEDIDTLFLNRDEAESKGDKDYNGIINKLLQFLDSNSSPDNVIFIATTNHLERLDEALIREGRFDLKLEVNEITKEDVTRFIETFDLPGDLTDEIIDIYVEKKKQEHIDRKIREYEKEHNDGKHLSNEARAKYKEENDLTADFNPHFTRYNQSLMQNIIMSKINKSDKIESVIDTGEIVVEDKNDEEDDY